MTTLAAILEAAASEIPGCLAVRIGDTTTWAIGAGAPFARLAPAGAEFRLDAAIAVAARRTSGASNSANGPDWVAFRPASLDRYAEDRLRAWFAAAARRAAG